MAGIPAFLLTHTVVIEPYLGESGSEPVYGPASAPIPCFVDYKARTIRGPNGTTVTSNSQIFAPLNTVCPDQSRVTCNGVVSTVLAAYRRDGGGLPTPDHLELVLV